MFQTLEDIDFDNPSEGEFQLLELLDPDEDNDEVDDEQAPISDTIEVQGPNRLQKVCESLGKPYKGQESWVDILLDLCPADAQAGLRNFIATCEDPDYQGQSLEPVGDFLDSPSTTWASHDREIDEYWHCLVDETAKLVPNLDRLSMVKPSGPLRAPLATMWHYPTYNTKKTHGGMVMDPSNHSLRAQKEKIGMVDNVRTQDRIMLRQKYNAHGVYWAQIYDRWEEIQALFDSFNKQLSQWTKVMIVLGKDNNNSTDKFVYLGPEEVFDDIELNTSVNLWGRPTYLRAIRHQTTGEILRLILPSFHGQSFFYKETPHQVRAYHDLLWNAACEMVGLWPNNSTFFLGQAQIRRVNGSSSKKQHSQLAQAMSMRAQEKETNLVFSEDVVRQVFAKTLDKNFEWAKTFGPDASTGSWIKPIMSMWSNKQWPNKFRDPNYRHTEAYAKQHAHLVGLLNNSAEKRKAKAKARLQSQEWKESAAGQKTKARSAVTGRWPQGVRSEKRTALLRVKQVRELLAADVSTLHPKQRTIRDRLDLLQAGIDVIPHSRLKTLFQGQVVWWAPEQQGGLRYDKDKAPYEDMFDYENVDHPAVRVDRPWTVDEKAAFLGSVAQGPNTSARGP